jgi:hypothetical protein
VSIKGVVKVTNTVAIGGTVSIDNTVTVNSNYGNIFVETPTFTTSAIVSTDFIGSGFTLTVPNGVYSVEFIKVTGIGVIGQVYLWNGDLPFTATNSASSSAPVYTGTLDPQARIAIQFFSLDWTPNLYADSRNTNSSSREAVYINVISNKICGVFTSSGTAPSTYTRCKLWFYLKRFN